MTNTNHGTRKKLESQPLKYPCLSPPILQLIKQMAEIKPTERIRARDGKRQVQDAPLREVGFMNVSATNQPLLCS